MIKKIRLSVFVIVCLSIWATCLLHFISMANTKINGVLLNNDSLSDNSYTFYVNKNHNHYRLIPSKKKNALEEEHVIYAIKNNETKFLTPKEMRLYEIVNYYYETYKDKPELEKIYAAVTMVDYLCRYDKTIDDKDRDTAYSCFVKRKGVCSNYARGLQVLLSSVNIFCGYISGPVTDGRGNHAWNIIKLEDQFFHTDVTWCDNTDYIDEYYRIRPKLTYFLMNDSEASMSRKWNCKMYPASNGDSKKYIKAVEEIVWNTATNK